MNCLKCGCEIKYNSVMCLKRYSKIKDDGEICLISSLDKERSDEIEWLFATKNFGEVSFVEDYVIQVDADIAGGAISALYTGLLDNLIVHTYKNKKVCKNTATFYPKNVH